MIEKVQKEDELSLLPGITLLLALQLGHHFTTAIVHQSLNRLSLHNTLMHIMRNYEDQNF
jgi:hypothetical protein